MERVVFAVVAGALALAGSAPAAAQTLRGSPQAMQQQYRVAQDHDYTFLQTAAQVRRFVELGLLVRLPGNANYMLASVSYPYARPEVKLFIERLSAQYRAACGEQLVVTSLTRPVREQPRNASHLSVHPAGMAVDLRVSGRAACRNWLERTLMSLERQGVLNAIRESRPPHYHVALYPTPYTRYVDRLTNGAATAQLASARTGASGPSVVAANGTAALQNGAAALQNGTAALQNGTAALQNGAHSTGARVAATLASQTEAVATYRVNRGDSLWSIARRHGTTVERLQQLNGLRSSRIIAGQRLTVPAAAATDDDEA
jgi:LysM repeat protein